MSEGRKGDGVKPLSAEVERLVREAEQEHWGALSKAGYVYDTMGTTDILRSLALAVAEQTRREAAQAICHKCGEPEAFGPATKSHESVGLRGAFAHPYLRDHMKGCWSRCYADVIWEATK